MIPIYNISSIPQETEKAQNDEYHAYTTIDILNTFYRKNNTSNFLYSLIVFKNFLISYRMFQRNIILYRIFSKSGQFKQKIINFLN